MKGTIIIILSTFIGQIVFSQTPVTFPEEKFAPVSPQVAALASYGNIPVNKYVGRPSVSIPIYEINTGDLQLPITLTYNYSGLKISENPTRVGLGWFLNAGNGMITQQVRGVDDNGDWTGYGYADPNVSSRVEDYVSGNSHEERKVYWRDAYAGNTITNTFPNVNCQVIENVRGGSKYDTEPDIYQYNFGGHSGKFVFDKNEDIHLVPQKPLDISRTRTPYPQSEDYWTAVDEKGVKYVFSKKESGESSFYNNTTLVNSRSSYSWLLDKIISSSGKDSIVFEYDYYANEIYPLTLSQTRKFPGHYSSLQGDPTGISNRYIQNSGTTHVLKRIVFKNGSVEFIPGDVREDASNSWKKTLGNISVKDARGTIIKNFDFDYGYWESGGSEGEFYNKRLYLDQVQERIGDELLPPYEFTYFDDYTFPTRQTSPDDSGYGYYAQDYWGYYNGNTSNSTLLTSLDSYESTYNINNFSAADRTPNYQYAKLGMLTQIKYPTGGYTNFEYGPHQYIGSSDLGAGGLRIERIKDCSDISNCVTRRYAYYDGVLISEKILNIMETEHRYYSDNECGELERALVVNSHTAPPIEGVIVGYSKVETFVESSTEGDNGKTVEYFTNDKYTIEETYSNSPFQSEYDFSWRRGLTLKVENYKRIGSSTYQLVRSLENEYNFLQDSEGLFGSLYRRLQPTNPNIYGLNLTVVNGLQFFPVKERYISSNYVDLINANLEFDAYLDNHYHIISEWNYRTKNIERIYDGSTDFMETVTNYFYDNVKHLQLTRSETTDSKGNTANTKTYYPDDVNELVGLTIDEKNAIVQLNSDNMHRVAVPIQTEIDQNGKKNTQRIIFNDEKWPGLFVPEFIQTSKGANVLENRVTFHQYDITKGLPMEFSRDGGIHTMYVWGYNDTQVIAKIENASYETLTSAQQIAIDNAISSSDYDVWFPGEDDLRSKLAILRQQFPDAMVSTYTYDPLVGVTSMTDSKGLTSHYLYDDFQRLEYVMDDDGKVLSKNTYNYKNQ